MTRVVWDMLLVQARAAHQGSAALNTFCPFPDDIIEQEVTPHHTPACDLLQAERDLDSPTHSALRDAFVAGCAHAHWRETYKHTDIGQDFLDRFGCYCLIGPGGPFHSDAMAAWVVYMPSALHYPWHHHPAEEMYLVLAGEAEFLRDGLTPERLHAGNTCQHTANQPHAMTTHDSPVMAYVVWRNGFGIPPVLTE